MRIGLPPFETGLACVDPPLPAHLIDELQEQLDGRIDIDVRNEALGAVTPMPCSPCLWLDPHTKLCKHYEYRPQLCRDFFCGDECLIGG